MRIGGAPVSSSACSTSAPASTAPLPSRKWQGRASAPMSHPSLQRASHVPRALSGQHTHSSSIRSSSSPSRGIPTFGSTPAPCSGPLPRGTTSTAAASTSAVAAPRGRGRPPKNTGPVDPATGLPQLKGRGMAVDESPLILEEGAPDLPKPSSHQQTLIRSFTLGGIGLHTGEYAYVRVRPAFAGEGRYFVCVVPGTNARLFKTALPNVVSLEDIQEHSEALDVVDPAVEEAKVMLFNEYLRQSQDFGFTGSFLDYMEASTNSEMRDAIMKGEPIQDEWTYDNPEPAWPRGAVTAAREVCVDAHISSVRTSNDYAVDLCSEDMGVQIMSVELLLAALESCGIDNARIEIEGGFEVDRSYEGPGLTAWRVEVPILDGSALGWTIECQFAGVRPALLPPSTPEEALVALEEALVADAELCIGDEFDEEGEEDEEGEAGADDAEEGAEGEADLNEEAEEGEEGEEGEDEAEEPERSRKDARMVGTPISVRDGASFITMHPDQTPRMTVGIDFSYDAFVIGKQWFSHAPLEDIHFRFTLAGARGFVARRELLLKMREEGMVQGGSEGVLLIGFDERWYDPELVRFVRDEPVRHTMVRLIGLLALLAPKGGQGIPVGHVLAYRPTTALMLKFVREVFTHYSAAKYWVAPVEVSEEQVDAWAAQTEDEWAATLEQYDGQSPLAPKGREPVDAEGRPLRAAGLPEEERQTMHVFEEAEDGDEVGDYDDDEQQEGGEGEEGAEDAAAPGPALLE